MNATQLLEHFDRLAEAPDAVARLRRFILDLAVRGQLVEQDAGAEPAECLLKQCELERAKAVAAGVVRKEKPPPILNDVPYLLPVGWVWARLGSTGRIFNGDSVSESEKVALSKVTDGYPFIATKDVGYGWQQLNYVNGLRVPVGASALKVLRADSVLICAEGGSAGKKTGLTDRKICFGNKLFANEPWEGISASYLLALYQSSFFYKEFSSRMTGIIGGISRAEFVLLPVPIPPAEEQMRIVAKVDELMALCDQLEAAQQERERRRDRLAAASLQRLNQHALDATPEAQREHARFYLKHLLLLISRPAHIKATRRAILNLAVRGKLVEQVVDAEPASVLLKRLQADIKSYGIQNRVHPAAVSAITHGTAPYALPAGWVWARMASLCRVVTDGDHLPPPKSDHGVAFLTIGNVSSGALSFANSRYVSQDYFDKITPYRKPELGDILYTVVGASYGRPVLVETDQPFCVQRHIAILKPAADLQLRYLHLLLKSQFVYDQATASLTGTAQPTIPLRPLRNFLIPLPPLGMQHRIVAKVDELMALCDQLEAQLTTTQTDSRRLLEAVLETALAPV